MPVSISELLRKEKFSPSLVGLRQGIPFSLQHPLASLLLTSVGPACQEGRDQSDLFKERRFLEKGVLTLHFHGVVRGNQERHELWPDKLMTSEKGRPT